MRTGASRNAVQRASILAFAIVCASVRGEPGSESARYSSPLDLAYSVDGRELYVSDFTAGRMHVLSTDGRKVIGSVELRGKPSGLAVDPTTGRVFCGEYDARTVAEIDPASRRVVRRLDCGLRPMGVAVAVRRRQLVVANTVEDDVTLIDLRTGRARARIAVSREPMFVAVSPDESLALVGNSFPSGSALEDANAATVSFIDLERGKLVAELPLESGSTTVREIAFSPDGRWAYVVHAIGHQAALATNVSWIVDNAVTIIDVPARRVYAAPLLSDYGVGSPDGWGLAVSSDGKELWASAAGSGEVVTVDLARLPAGLRGERLSDTYDASLTEAFDENLWEDIYAYPALRMELVTDRKAMRRVDLIAVRSTGLRSPRGIALSPRGGQLAVAGYHSAAVAFLDEKGALAGTVSLGDSGERDLARRGEMLFHDATISAEQRASCATCHPDNGRTDALRWDLPNDGVGTPQKTRSLLWSHLAKRTTARGVRDGMPTSVAAGARFLGHRAKPNELAALEAYLRELKPEPSPYLLAGGELSPAAKRGREIFADKAGCDRCHRGELRSDFKRHDVGTGPVAASDRDRAPAKVFALGEAYVTPRLVELYRTGPFLHDGRAATLREIFERYNPEGRHGKTDELTDDEFDDLIEYLKSL